MPGPAGDGSVLHGSAHSRLLEQKAHLQHALEGLERQLQEIIDHLTSPPVSLPIQSTADEPGMKSLLQQSAGERKEPARALLEQKENEASQEVAEDLQSQMDADKEGSYYVSTLRQRYEELKVQLMEMADENIRPVEENSRLREQMQWAEKVEAENVNLKGQLRKVAEKENSARQDISCLQTKPEDAECELKALREMAERWQQLEKEGEETKAELQRKEKQDKFLQRAQTDGKREHQEAMQLFQNQVSELENQFQSPSKSAWAEDSLGSCLLSEEDSAGEAEKLSIILKDLGPQTGKL